MITCHLVRWEVQPKHASLIIVKEAFYLSIILRQGQS